MSLFIIIGAIAVIDHNNTPARNKNNSLRLLIVGISSLVFGLGFLIWSIIDLF